MKKSIFVLVLLLSVLAACDTKVTYEKADNRHFTMEVPSFMSKTKDQNEIAVLHYQDLIKGLYVMVVEEKKDEVISVLEENELYDDSLSLIERYAGLCISMYKTNTEGYKELNRRDTTINGNESLLLDFNGTSEGYDVYYKVAFINTGGHLYQVMVWTDDKSKGKHMAAMDHMLNSFKAKGRKSAGVK